MTLKVLRRAGAVAIVAVGAVHLQQYLGADYREVPTIGPLFLSNAIAAGVVGVGLLMPIEKLFGARGGERVVGLLALGAVAIAVGSLIALFIAESGPLFGFSEDGYDTLLAPVAVASLARAAADRGGARRRGGAVTSST